jgi:hypothetical protein
MKSLWRHICKEGTWEIISDTRVYWLCHDCSKFGSKTWHAAGKCCFFCKEDPPKNLLVALQIMRMGEKDLGRYSR